MSNGAVGCEAGGHVVEQVGTRQVNVSQSRFTTGRQPSCEVG